MSDDERDPPGDGNDDEQTPRRLGVLAAFGWSSVGVFFSVATLMISLSIRPGLSLDVVNNIACSAMGFTLAMLLALFIHLPDLEVPDALGVRPTSPLLVVLAALVGGVLQVPTTWMSSAIERRFPRPQAELDHLAALFSLPRGAYRVAFAVGAVALGPLVEELLFRGVLFRGLRRAHARTVVVLATAFSFSVMHLDARKFLPILVCGLVLGHLRERAGSLGPSLVGHMTFNGLTTFGLLAGWSSMDEATTRIPFAVGAGSIVALFVLLALYTWLAERSALAAEGREADAS